RGKGLSLCLSVMTLRFAAELLGYQGAAQDRALGSCRHAPPNPDADPVLVPLGGIEQIARAIKQGVLDETIRIDSGQERRYRGKLEFAPLPSKLLNTIGFLAGWSMARSYRLFYRR